MSASEKERAVFNLALRMKAALVVAPDVFEGIEMSDYQIAWLAAAAYEARLDEESENATELVGT